jgi:hypothetical protein
MTDFDYLIEVERIKSAKFVFELEELVRKHTLSSYEHYQLKLSLHGNINRYKIATLALKQFVAKSKKPLPDFIHDSITRLEQAVLKFLITEPISYEEFIDCFQYKLGTIKCSRSDQYNMGYPILKSIALIVGTNPQPYTFDWAHSSNPMYRELISGKANQIIELEHFKQQNQLVNNTVVELELANLYESIKPDLTQVSEVHEFVLQIDKVYSTIKSKLNQ